MTPEHEVGDHDEVDDDDDVVPPRRAPDAFFPGVPRYRVVLLGLLFIVVGLLVAVFVAPLTVVPESGSTRISGFFFVIGLAVAVLGGVFLFKKPTRGSEPDSEKYRRLIAREDASAYRYFMRNMVVASVLSALLAAICVYIGVQRLESDAVSAWVPFAGGVVFALSPVACALTFHAARQGRLKRIKPPPRSDV